MVYHISSGVFEICKWLSLVYEHRWVKRVLFWNRRWQVWTVISSMAHSNTKCLPLASIVARITIGVKNFILRTKSVSSPQGYGHLKEDHYIGFGCKVGGSVLEYLPNQPTFIRSLVQFHFFQLLLWVPAMSQVPVKWSDRIDISRVPGNSFWSLMANSSTRRCWCNGMVGTKTCFAFFPAFRVCQILPE